VASRRPRQTRRDAVAPTQADCRQSDQMPLAGRNRGGGSSQESRATTGGGSSPQRSPLGSLSTRVTATAGGLSKTSRGVVTQVEPERDARSAAAQKERPSGRGRGAPAPYAAGGARFPSQNGHSRRPGTHPVLPGGRSARPSICARSSSRKRAQSARRSSETNSPGGSDLPAGALSGCCSGSRNHSPLSVETVDNSCV
jgi:hypothetical protein